MTESDSHHVVLVCVNFLVVCSVIKKSLVTPSPRRCVAKLFLSPNQFKTVSYKKGEGVVG